MVKKSLAFASTMTLALLYGLLALLVLIVCKFAGATTPVAFAGALIALAIQFLIGPWLTDLSMRLFYKADFNPELPEYLTSFVEDVCREHNMKTPRMGLINDGAPNAFTYGRTKNDARVVITRGILELLDEEQVKAVVAHELGHAAHYDMLVMTVAQVVPLVMYGVYEGCSKAATSSSKSSKNSKDNSGAVLLLLAAIAYVLYLISQLIILWLSRTREYFADEFSVEETQNPAALAGALVTIGYGLSTRGGTDTKNRHSVASPNTLGISDAKSSKAMAVCCADADPADTKQHIRNAMKWDMWNVWAKIYELGATHPLISKRLLAISERSEEFGQERYITFDEQKPESYVDDFARECLICFLPGALLIATVVCLAFRAGIAAAVCVLGAAVMSLVKFSYRRPNKEMPQRTVRELIGEVKVSGVTSIPCELTGTVIGRGNPGCVFNEDFVIRDETGIVMLDYNQPLFIINKFFALFRSPEYFDKQITVHGWYRRSPVPYVELRDMEIDGKVKKCWTYQVGKVLRIVGIVLAAVLAFGFAGMSF